MSDKEEVSDHHILVFLLLKNDLRKNRFCYRNCKIIEVIGF